MRKVRLPGLDLETSCLGMGCASLGSRIEAKDGLRALQAAYKRGVRWFDVAPAYGAGSAEDILGAFLKIHGADCQVCTKVGLAPPKKGALKSAILALGRKVARFAKPLKDSLRGSKLLANRRITLTPDLLKSSIDNSLQRLHLDRVAIYALHNADPADLEREEIVRTLEDILSSGKAGAISVAGDLEAARAALAAGGPCRAVQIGMTLGQDAPAIIGDAASRGMDVITHSVFGVSGSLHSLTKALSKRPDLAARLEEQGYHGSLKSSTAQLLLERALALNPAGVTLTSMFSEKSLAMNAAVAEKPVMVEKAALFDEITAALDQA